MDDKKMMTAEKTRDMDAFDSHNVCERDWFTTSLSEMPQDGTDRAKAFRNPVRVVKGEDGGEYKGSVCCMCGTPTVSGIFTRMRNNDDRLLCSGDHDHAENWSPVIAGAVMPS